MLISSANIRHELKELVIRFFFITVSLSILLIDQVFYQFTFLLL